MVRWLAAVVWILMTAAAHAQAVHTLLRSGAAWSNAIDVQTDAVLLENIDSGYPERVRFWTMQGYAVYAVLPAGADEASLKVLTQSLSKGLRGVYGAAGAPGRGAELQARAQAQGTTLEILNEADFVTVATPPRPDRVTRGWEDFGRAWRNNIAGALASDPQRLQLLAYPEQFLAADDGSAAWKQRLDPAVAEGILAVGNALAQALAASGPWRVEPTAYGKQIARGALHVFQNTTDHATTITLTEPVIDLLSRDLAIMHNVRVAAHDVGFVVDLPSGTGPAVLAGTARLRPAPAPKHPRNSATAARRLMGQMRGPAETEGRIRVLLPRAPGYTVFNWNPTEVLGKTTEWDPATHTALFRFRNMGVRQFMEINW